MSPVAPLLAGRVAWVTGATGGIGRAIAETFAAAGAQLILAGRQADELTRLAETIVADGGLAPLVQVYDVRDNQATVAAFQVVFKQTRRLDILVYCAGVMQDAPLGMITPAAIDETLQVNVAALLTHLQYGAKLMTRSGGGSIINLSSLVGLTGNAQQTLYAASKAAVIGATRSAARELAAKGIRVNALAPGYIETRMTSHYSAAVKHKSVASIGLGRAGTPGDVAKAALFFASDLSAYVTGQVLGVDGGMVLPNA